MAEKDTSKKVRGRPFQRGNPGRPRGSKNRTTLLVEQLVAGEAANLTRRILELALQGNVKCLQICFERLSPRRNGRPIDFSLPAISNMHDIVKATAEVATAVNNGNLTAEEAGQLVHVLDSYSKVFMAHDFAMRLETLESQLKKKP